MRIFKTLLVLACFLIAFSGITLAQQKEIPKATAKDNTFIVNVDFHCGGGKTRIESGLKGIEGIKKVTADLTTKNVTIEHDSEVITTAQLVRYIERIGHRTEYTSPETKIKSACSHAH